MQGGRAGSFRGLQAQTTSCLGTTLKADEPLQPPACREASRREGLGCPNLGFSEGGRPWDQTGVLGAWQKKCKGHTKGAFLNEKNKTFPTVDFKRRIFKNNKDNVEML